MTALTRRVVRSDYRAPQRHDWPAWSASIDLDVPVRRPFGRARTAARAHARARRGDGTRVALLGGEPGSGKSRLVREFAAEAADDGALVLYGACDAQVRTPYGAFVDALDQLARETETDELRAALGAGGGELTRLLPELGARIDDLPPAVEADPDTERHRLHTAVAELLAGVTAAAAGAARARGRALGRRSHAAAPASPRARGQRPCAAARHLPRHRGGHAARGVGAAGRPAPLRRRPAERGRALRRRGGRVRPAHGRGRAGHRARRAGQRDPRPDRRQRLPGLRALARARRDRRGGAGRR